MFDPEEFVEACKAATLGPEPHRQVRELVARAVSDPSAALRALGEPTLAAINTLYRSDTLTVLNIAWGPGMRFPPHDHRMWAVIGILGGQEDNLFYRREGNHAVEDGGRSLVAKDTVMLGKDVIHAVNSPLDVITPAIHVYGGDFFGTPRSEYDPQSLEERPYDLEANLRRFEDCNERLRAARSG